MSEREDWWVLQDIFCPEHYNDGCSLMGMEKMDWIANWSAGGMSIESSNLGNFKQYIRHKSGNIK